MCTRSISKGIILLSARIAMNTTRTTSESHRVPYTVVTGQRESRIPKQSPPLTILLLNRVGKFNREEFLAENQDLGFAEILCVEGTESSYDIDSRARKFPAVRFLLLKDDVSIGAQIKSWIPGGSI